MVRGLSTTTHVRHLTLSFWENPPKRWLLSLTPKCGTMLIKNIKRRYRFTWYSWVLISVINTIFVPMWISLGPDLGPPHLFLDQLRAGSGPTTLWYLFSIWLICRPLRRLLKWRMQIFRFSVKGCKCLGNTDFWAKIRGVVWGQNLHECILHSHVWI